MRQLILQKKGYRVVSATSGQEALALLEKQPFDLILTDQIMPGMSGTELAKAVKSGPRAIPVIIVSGVNELPGDISEADLFISKIQGPAALFDGISRILNQYRTAQ